MVAATSCLLLFVPLWASADVTNTVQVSDAWVRESVPGQSIGAAYLRMRAKERVDLIAVKTAVSRSAELHRMSMKDGVMRMREVIAVRMSPNEDVALEPGGTHIMLIGLRRPLKSGDAVALTLIFRRVDGSTLARKVRAPVRPMAAEATHAH